MKQLTIYGLFATLLLSLTPPLQARDRDRDDRRDRDYHRDGRRDYHDSRSYYRQVDRTRTVWVIEGRRPVKRVVYIDSRGKYFRRVSGRTVYVRERIFESYPSRYYYSDGRPRVGIRINF